MPKSSPSARVPDRLSSELLQLPRVPSTSRLLGQPQACCACADERGLAATVRLVTPPQHSNRVCPLPCRWRVPPASYQVPGRTSMPACIRARCCSCCCRPCCLPSRSHRRCRCRGQALPALRRHAMRSCSCCSYCCRRRPSCSYHRCRYRYQVLSSPALAATHLMW